MAATDVRRTEGSRLSPEEEETLELEGGDEAGMPPPSVRQSCWERCLGSFVDAGATTPNWKYIFLMFISLFTSSFSLTYLFPFLPDMILMFGYREEEKGYYVGLVASCVFAGRACGSLFWGWLSDVKGRRLVLLLTILGNGLFTLIFGFTVNLPMAMILRFMAGLANGTVGAAKTVLYEISDNTNQALGMASISLAWGSGLVVGPTIGGLLASPAVQFPHIFSPDGFFGQFPFFLPSFIGFIFSMLGFTVVFFNFEETLHRRDTEISISTPPLEADVRSSVHLSVVPSSSHGARPAMSVEDLRCESEAAFYLVQIQSHHRSGSLKEETDNGCRHGEENERKRRAHSRSASTEDIHLSETRRTASPIATSFSSVPNVSSLHSGHHAHTSSSPSSSAGPTTLSQNGKTSNAGKPGTSNAIADCSPVRKSETHHDTCNVPEIIFAHAENGWRNGSSANVVENGETSTLLRQNGSTRKADSHVVVESDRDVTKEASVKPSHSGCFSGIKKSKLFKLAREPDVLKAVSLYTIFSFGVIGFDDVFTVWASTETRLDGLGFDSEEIGLALGALSIPMLILQLKLFPMLTRKFGIIKAFVICDCVLVFTVQAVPTLHLLHDQKTVLWILLSLLLVPNKMVSSSCFAATSLMINNSASPRNAGSINGIAMTTTAIARTLAPAVGGSMFAWTMTYGSKYLGPPFDVSFAFFVLGLVSFGTTIAGIFMPERLNSQKKLMPQKPRTEAA